MKNLIIPMAGKSSRFPGTRPKWMLTHPKSGIFMCIESILGLNLDFFDRIFFVILKDHEDTYQASRGIKKSLSYSGLSKEIISRCEIVILESPTKSQSETVFECIKKKSIKDFIFIKDSDGFFKFDVLSGENQVVYYDLNKMGEVEAKSKSYIQTDSNGIITNMVEKKVISSKFCVGGYGFKSAESFCRFYESLKDLPGECFVSNVIFEMVLEKFPFLSAEARDFIDWGTLKSWNGYKSEFKTLFLDLDGTLVSNTSHLVPPFIGDSYPLEENIKCVKNLYSSGKCKIIITTSRPEEYRGETIGEMKKYGIPFDLLIMGLPHSQRILVNDFSATNPFPSCSSINVERNSNGLQNYLNK